MKAIEVLDSKFTDIHWQEFAKLLENLHEKYNSFHNRVTWERKKDTLLSVYEMDKTQHRYIIFDDNKITGWLDFHIQNKGTKSELAFIGFDGMYDEFPDEFSHIAASTLLQLAKKHNCEKMYIMSNNQRSSKVARDWGGTEICIINRYELRRRDTENKLLELWVNNGKRQNPDLTMKFFTEPPEEILERYVELLCQCLNDMPHENESETQFLPTIEELKKFAEWRKKNNKTMSSMMLYSPEDTLIGFSDVSIDKDNPSNVFQLLTGIDREYRGRKLSKWLKAANIMKIYEDFPENKLITTDMRAVNRPIQKINEQLGYRLVSEGNEFDLTSQMLINWLT
ncbi:MAG: hypothetical protein KAR42_11475 [candidate division Zixibacteria bacterium]|nr:hypothetical protein [candidate division Zixibacteria bacterium]